MRSSTASLGLAGIFVALFCGPGAPLAHAQLVAASRGVMRPAVPMEDDAFGRAVAVEGDLAVIGSERTTGGIVYVFERAGLAWTQRAMIQAPDTTRGDGFGRAVATDGTRIVIGAPQDDTPVDSAGAAYVFVRGADASEWTMEQKLTYATARAYDLFGAAVAIDGNRLVVGCIGDDFGASGAGSVFVFQRIGAEWREEAHLLHSGLSINDGLGEAVAIDGTTIAAGASRDSMREEYDGSVYVWTLRGTVWTEQARLLATEGTIYSYFGTSLDLEGDQLIVGAPRNDAFEAMDPYRGVAHVFTRTGTTWTMTATLLPPMRRIADDFGASVAIAGDVAVVGAPGIPVDGRSTGSTFYYVREAGVWGPPTALPPGLRSAECGSSVGAFGIGVEGTSMLTACTSEDGTARDEGAVHAFELVTVRPTGAGCMTDSECTTSLCIDGVCCATECGFGDGGDCQACSVAAGAAVDGTCGPVALGRTCRASFGPCDAPEACDGSTLVCPMDRLEPATTECRPSTGACDPAELCDGARSACPADAYAMDGTACDDGASCNGAEICDSGACSPGLPMTCDDGDACTADMCSEPGTCGHEPIADCCVEAADCAPIACMTASCEANRCSYAADSECMGDGGAGADAGPSSPPSASGCSCATPGSSSGMGVGTLALLALALAAVRRRRG